MNARTLTAALSGRWHGGYGLAFCPAHPNTRTPALILKDGDDGKLLVYCFTGCDGTDVLAALRARGLLEGHSDWPTDHRRIVLQIAGRKAATRRRIEQARRCWHESGPISGTLGERYLRSRGIAGPISRALRFHPKCWHGPSARTVPAMIAPVSATGRLFGVHRTYLAEPGVKAFGRESKLMLGRCRGGAAKLSGGSGSLLIAEGVETALSLLAALPDARLRVWAALSASGVGNLVLPPEPGELMLAPDGDAAGRRAARKLADRASAAGWRVRIMECPDGRDWNDIAQEVAA